MPAIVALLEAPPPHHGKLGLVTVIPNAATDADREEIAAACAPLTVWIDRLDAAARTRLLAAVRRSPTGFLVGTARWFELLLNVATVPGATADTVADFATFAMRPPDGWLPRPPLLSSPPHQ